MSLPTIVPPRCLRRIPLDDETLRDRRDALAADVWIRSVVYGSILGSVGAVVILVVGFATDPFAPRILALYFAPFAIALGAGFGFFVGVVVGLALGVLVGFGHERLAPRTIATLIPLVAMVLTLPVTFASFRSNYATPMVIFCGLDALFTLVGSLAIACGYLESAR